jgi:hypothetical protein
MNNDQNNDPNREETEEKDGIRLGTLRRLQALHRSKALVAQTRAWLASQKNTPETTDSPPAACERLSQE